MSANSPKRRKHDHPSQNVDIDDELGTDYESSVSGNDAELIASSGNGSANGNMVPNTVQSPKGLRPRTKPMPTKDMYNSDMFQIQLNELLVEVRLNYEKLTTRVEKTLRKLKQTIESIPARAPQPIYEASLSLQKDTGIAVPWPDSGPTPDLKYSVAFAKPDGINVVGSFVLKTSVQHECPTTIDMAVTMPSILFQEKDYLNYRYFHKRAYYLACMASAIDADPDCKVHVQYEYQNESPLQPVLLISPALSVGDEDFSYSKCRIRIISAVNSSVFEIGKTLPWKNCVRSKPSDSLSASPTLSTSVYNATLRAESCVASYLKLLHGVKAKADGFTSACILGHVWLRQRGFGTGLLNGGFGGFEIACMIALLLQSGGPKGRPLLSGGYSSSQIFKAILQFLASSNLMKTPLILGGGDSYDQKAFKMGTPVLFDSIRGLNILYKMSPWSYKKLQHEARTSLELLNSTLPDRFGPTFISKVNDALYGYDTVIQFPIATFPKSKSNTNNETDRLLHHCTTLYTALSTGLGDRVRLIYPKVSVCAPWTIKQSSPKLSEMQDILIGFLLDPNEAGRAVDRGPPAEDKKAAAAFQKFWGEKAELRRFQDGSILESLIWTEKGQSRSILQQIVFYITNRHFDVEAANGLRFIADDFDHLLPGNRASSTAPLASFQPSMEAFEALAKQIRELEGLPLQIRQVSASCADLRYSSILPNTQGMIHGPQQPMDVTVQFEGSNRWPEDITAIQMTKIAFSLKLGELLEEAVPSLTTRVGLENQSPSQNLLNSSFLDILPPGQPAFRLRIHHELELSLLSRRLKDKSLDPHSREAAASAIAAHKSTFIHLPAHTQALTMLCTRFPALSPSIRLLKHWCASHLLLGHLSEPLIELLAIHPFTKPYPYTPPASPRAAFLRTLAFIARWDWRDEPLLVSLGTTIPPSEIDAITTRFDAWRHIDPALNRVALFAASTLDPSGIAWTERSPSKLVAARLASLAQAATALVKAHGAALDARALFVSSLADYDFVLHIHPKVLGRAPKTAKPVFKNLPAPEAGDRALVGYEPVRWFVEELERVYGAHVVFFCNASVQDVVAGLWSPLAEERAWKVGLGYSSVPMGERGVKGEGEGEGGAVVGINKAGILNDIARLGGDMIARIDVKGKS
ncbi:hypothetical protein MMC11_001858 [Xylographa trunciseda]|nr:hypothetical protein [Xylographa trunciseda]